MLKEHMDTNSPFTQTYSHSYWFVWLFKRETRALGSKRGSFKWRRTDTMILVVCDLYIQQIHKNQKRRRRGKQSQHDLTEFATERRYLCVCTCCVPERVCVYICVCLRVWICCFLQKCVDVSSSNRLKTLTSPKRMDGRTDAWMNVWSVGRTYVNHEEYVDVLLPTLAENAYGYVDSNDGTNTPNKKIGILP